MTATTTTATATWTCVRVPSTFPVENHPIHVTPVAPMTHKTKADSYPKMARAVAKVLAMHPDERVLVHTVSYDLSRFLLRELLASMGAAKKRLMTYDSAGERDKTVERFRATEGAVLIASSLERGVDFKGDECRVVVVAKIPYPNIGDRQVSARLHSKGGERWYATHTVRSLVQMTGRAMRSADDHCTTYILDTQFVDGVLKKSKALLPTWWKAGLDISAKYVPELTRP